MHSSIEILFVFSLFAGFLISLLLFLSGGRMRLHFLRFIRIPRLLRIPRIGAVPVAPMFFGMFLTIFGAAGLVFDRFFTLSGILSFTIAFIVAAIFAFVCVSITSWFFAETATELKGQHFAGTTGRVTLAIPETGIGTIACVIDGKRVCLPARSRSNEALAKDKTVMIVDFVDRIALVVEL